MDSFATIDPLGPLIWLGIGLDWFGFSFSMGQRNAMLAMDPGSGVEFATECSGVHLLVVVGAQVLECGRSHSKRDVVPTFVWAGSAWVGETSSQTNPPTAREILLSPALRAQ